MADVDFDEFEDGFDAPSRLSMGRWVNMAGAACSVALIVGLGVWGYKLAVRDVSGIPVVRALAGPLRIAPEAPGGEVALHQGLSVNAVASAGTALPLPDKLTLAPREAELSADDTAGSAVISALPSGAVANAEQPEMSAAVLPDAAVALVEAPIELAPVEIAPEAQAVSSADETPLPATQEEAVAAALAAALADDGASDASGAEGATVVTAEAAPMVRPRPRPAAKIASKPAVEAELVSAAASAPEVGAPAAAPAPVGEIDPATIPAGTRLVQLGAFDDEASARAGWVALQGQFPELIGGKAMVIQSAQSGGRTFFRLRAHGFAGEDEARQFCAAMLAENASCIPVAQR